MVREELKWANLGGDNLAMKVFGIKVKRIGKFIELLIPLLIWGLQYIFERRDKKA